MTITDQITALLSADPIYGGRVTGETVRAIAEIVSERAAIVAWLRAEQIAHEGSYQQARERGDEGAMDRCAVRSRSYGNAADAIERGDFGAAEG